MSSRARPIVVIILLGLCAGPTLAVTAERVVFTTYDGVAIAADYYPPKPGPSGAPMVILLHMYRSDRSAWKPLIEPLHEAGFAILALDLRGHGESATEQTRRRVIRRDTSVFEEMYHDVRAAYDFLARQQGIDRSRFALVGASVGCSVALRYAARDRSVDAIVCLSPGADYLGLDSRRDIRQVKGRKLWLIASDEPREGAGVETLAPLGEGVTTRLLPNADHGTRMFARVPELAQRVADWLKANVGPPTDTTVYGSINSDVFHLPGSGWIERIKAKNLRHYSSPAEAIARGLRAAKSRGPDDRPDKKDEP